MGLPPSEVGAVQANVNCVSPLAASSLYRLVGGEGTSGSAGTVAPFPTLDSSLSPISLVAVSLALIASSVSKKYGLAFRVAIVILQLLLSITL